MSDKKIQKKKKRPAGRLFDRDNRSLKQRLKDYAMGSDNYSRMSDLDGEHINYRDMHKVRNKKVKKGDK